MVTVTPGNVPRELYALSVGDVFKFSGMQYEDCYYRVQEGLAEDAYDPPIDPLVATLDVIYVQPGTELYTLYGHSTVLITGKTLVE